MHEHVVTSVEYQRHVGRFGREAQRAPVRITHHGQDSLVLLSAAEYARLKRRDREVLTTAGMTDADRGAVAASRAPDSSAAFNHELDE